MLRGLYGMNMGPVGVCGDRKFSPFMILISISAFNSLKLRAEHKLYIHWIKHYYPKHQTIWNESNNNNGKITTNWLKISKYQRYSLGNP